MVVRVSNAVVMGVSGVGKTTVALRLAEAFGGHFVEGDTFHPPENIRAMSSGIPLTDEARWGWLARIAEAVHELNGKSSAPVFVACSALKRRYRDVLRDRLGPIVLVHLHGDPELIRQRLAARRGHFMPPALLDSQNRDLEPPSPAREGPMCRLDVALSVEEVVREAEQFCRDHLSGISTSRGHQ